MMLAFNSVGFELNGAAALKGRACRKDVIDNASIPKRVVSDSAASRNSEVEIALPFALSTGTSTKLRRMESKKVLPGGYCDFA